MLNILRLAQFIDVSRAEHCEKSVGDVHFYVALNYAILVLSALCSIMLKRILEN